MFPPVNLEENKRYLEIPCISYTIMLPIRLLDYIDLLDHRSDPIGGQRLDQQYP